MAAQVQALWQNAMVSRSFDSVIDHLAALDDLTLVTTPSLFIIALTPIYMRWYKQSEQLFTPGLLLWLKLLGNSIAASLLVTCAAIYLSVAINIEHRHASKGSAVVALWLLFSVTCDVLRLLVTSRNASDSPVTYLATFDISLKCALMLLQEIPKSLASTGQDTSETTKCKTPFGFWTRLLWKVLPATLKFGFLDRLSLHDLEDLGPEYSSERLALRFQAVWAAEDKTSKYCLYWAIFKSLRAPILMAIPPYLLASLLTVINATSIHRLHCFLEQDMNSQSNGLHFIMEALGIQIGIIICRAISMYQLYRLATLVRGTLASAVYGKTLKLQYEDAQKAIAVSLIGSDIDSATGIPGTILERLSCAIQVCLGMFILVKHIGLSAFALCFPLAVSLASSGYIGRQLPATQLLWKNHLKDRVSRSLTFLSQIKAIRIAALEHVVANTIVRCFVDEIKSYIQFRYWSMLLAASVTCISILPIPSVLGASIFYMTSTSLPSQHILSILAMVTLLLEPIHEILTWPKKLESFKEFDSIQEFLLLQEAVDPRINSMKPSTEPTTFLVNEGQSHLRGLRNSEDCKPIPTECVIRLEHIYARPQNSSRTVLSDVNIALNRNELIVIAGPTGSGKSTFLRFIIGEAVRLSGTCYLKPGNMAYCSQTPWLRHVSVRDNIVNGLQFDQDWYNLVLYTCLLNYDVQKWSGGDETIVGTNGLNLSGGQRQKLALARSLYAKAPYLILDNVFTPLDSETSRQIFERLFDENGLMQQNPTTVILTTHLVPFIKSANQAVFIRQNGTISSHRDLDSFEFKQDLKSFKASKFSGTSFISPQYKEATTAAASLLSAYQQEQQNIRQTHAPWLYFAYLTTFDLPKIILWLPCVFIGSFSETSPELYMYIWLQVSPENNMFFFGYIALSLSALLFTMIDITMFFSYLVPTSAFNLHLSLLNTITHAKLEHITGDGSALLLNHLVHDVSFVSHTLPTYLVRLVAAACNVLGTLAPVITASRETIILIPFIFGIFYITQIYYLRISTQIRHLDLEHRAPLLTQLTEISSGLQHVRAFGWQKQALDSSFRLLDASQKPFYYMLIKERWLDIVMNILTATLVMFFVVFGVLWRQSITAISVSLPLTALISANITVRALLRTWATFDSSMVAFARIHDFITSTPVEKDKLKDCVKELPRGWPSIGNIEMADVTAQYENHSSSGPAITDVSMLITEGKRVGIAGRTGSGKSSLLLTLLNFIGYTGEITIDGVDISKMPRHVLRTRITTITQELIMLEGTVRYNLCPWNPRDLGLKDRVPDFSMITFLESLGIWAHIESEGGLDAELSEVGLSEGQMQLFSVARGMVHNLATSSRIVILDEPTSNLDPAAEEVVLRVLKDALYDHTILLLSHNPEIMTDLDSVTRMENGRIVEDPEQDDKEAKDVKSKSSKSAGKKKAKSNATASSSTEPPPVEPYYQKLMDHMDNPAENPPPFPPRRTAVARLKRKYKRTYGIDAAPTWL